MQFLATPILWMWLALINGIPQLPNVILCNGSRVLLVSCPDIHHARAWMAPINAIYEMVAKCTLVSHPDIHARAWTAGNETNYSHNHRLTLKPLQLPCTFHTCCSNYIARHHHIVTLVYPVEIVHFYVRPELTIWLWLSTLTPTSILKSGCVIEMTKLIQSLSTVPVQEDQSKRTHNQDK